MANNSSAMKVGFSAKHGERIYRPDYVTLNLWNILDFLDTYVGILVDPHLAADGFLVALQKAVPAKVTESASNVSPEEKERQQFEMTVYEEVGHVLRFETHFNDFLIRNIDVLEDLVPDVQKTVWNEHLVIWRRLASSENILILVAELMTCFDNAAVPFELNTIDHPDFDPNSEYVLARYIIVGELLALLDMSEVSLDTFQKMIRLFSNQDLRESRLMLQLGFKEYNAFDLFHRELTHLSKKGELVVPKRYAELLSQLHQARRQLLLTAS